MKCPIYGAMNWELSNAEPSTFAECLNVECRWWDKELEDCGLFSIKLQLASIAEVLSTIARELTLHRPV